MHIPVCVSLLSGDSKLTSSQPRLFLRTRQVKDTTEQGCCCTHRLSVRQIYSLEPETTQTLPVAAQPNGKLDITIAAIASEDDTSYGLIEKMSWTDIAEHADRHPNAAASSPV